MNPYDIIKHNQTKNPKISKEKFIEQGGNNVQYIRTWNETLIRNVKPFTKKEYSEASGFNTEAIQDLNNWIQLEKFTIEEHRKAKGFDCAMMSSWNSFNPKNNRYTKKEHTEHKTLCATNIVLWNKSVNYQTVIHTTENLYSKKEFIESNGFQFNRISDWNQIHNNEEKFSRQEASDFVNVTYFPERLPEYAFIKYIHLINKLHKLNMKSYKQFMKKVKSEKI